MTMMFLPRFASDVFVRSHDAILMATRFARRACPRRLTPCRTLAQPDACATVRRQPRDARLFWHVIDARR